jgi:hypothetical protein
MTSTRLVSDLSALDQLQAGEYVIVRLQQRDAFGNAAYDNAIQSQILAVATYEDSTFAPVEYRALGYTGTLGSWELPVGGLPGAGIWALHVTLNGLPVPDGIRQIEVQPGPLDIAATIVTGSAVAEHFADGDEASVAAVRLYAMQNMEVRHSRLVAVCAGARILWDSNKCASFRSFPLSNGIWALRR